MYKTILAISIVVVALLGITTFIITTLKVRKMRNTLLTTSSVGEDPTKVRVRDSKGVISFVEYRRLKPLLTEIQVDFLLNTVVSMRYKKLIFIVKSDLFPIFEVDRWLKIKPRVILEADSDKAVVRAENAFNKTLKEIRKSSEDPEYEFIYIEGYNAEGFRERLEGLKPSRRPFFVFVTTSHKEAKEVRVYLRSRRRAFTSLPGSRRGVRFFFGFG